MNYDEDVKRRLRRMEGQIRGILKMMDENRHCKEVVSQLSAVRSAADKAMAYIVAVNLHHCIIEELGPELDAVGAEAGGGGQSGDGAGTAAADAAARFDTSKLIQEAVDLLIKSR